MSDTPRTDAITSYIPLSRLARQLERELAEALRAKNGAYLERNQRVAALEAENNDIRAVNLQLLDETRELAMLNSNQRAMLEGKHAYVGQDFQFRIDTQSKRIHQLERELTQTRKDAERLRACVVRAVEMTDVSWSELTYREREILKPTVDQWRAAIDAARKL